jgi:hypothetical protein
MRRNNSWERIAGEVARKIHGQKMPLQREDRTVLTGSADGTACGRIESHGIWRGALLSRRWPIPSRAEAESLDALAKEGSLAIAATAIVVGRWHATSLIQLRWTLQLKPWKLASGWQCGQKIPEPVRDTHLFPLWEAWLPLCKARRRRNAICKALRRRNGFLRKPKRQQ